MKNCEVMDEKEVLQEVNAVDVNSEAAMDKYLGSIGMFRKPVAKDGSCLFRAVAEQVYNTQEKHIDVRHECIHYMRNFREHFEDFVPKPFDHHLYDLHNPKEWAGQVEIKALSLLYRHDIVIYQEVNQSPQNVTNNGFKKKVLLCFSNGNHYDCVYPISFEKNAAIIQCKYLSSHISFVVLQSQSTNLQVCRFCLAIRLACK